MILNKRSRPHATAALFAVVVIALSSCGKSDDKGGVPQPVTEPPAPQGITASFKSIQANVFQKSCTGCHNPTKPKGGVDLTSYTSVMDTTPAIVKKNDAAGSPLYKAIAHLDTENVRPMPLGPPGTQPKKLADDQIKAVFDWIQAGAKDN